MKTNSLAHGKINIIVADNHTLGYMQKDSLSIGILQQSVLKGANTTQINGSISSFGINIRLATEIDFEEFNIDSEGFRKDESYHYIRN
jgi:hypothetical protein